MRPADRALFVLPVLLLCAIGCSGHRAISTASEVELVWPADDPRVRLERTIDLRNTRSGGSARFLHWLGGEKALPIFQRPYAVAWDGDDILVTDPGIGRVARISPGGRIKLSPEGALAQPIGIAACPQGILVTDPGADGLALLDRELEQVSWLSEGLSRPTGVGCDDERIFLAETAAHRIRVLGPGEEERELGRRGTGPGEFNFPAPIAIDGAALLVGDTLNFRIQRLDISTGRTLNVFGRLGDSPGETPRIKGLAVDAAGRVWVSDAILDRVSLYERDGTFLMSIGGTGADPGRFSFPAGIAAHGDGRVVVVDSLNRRLQIFALLEPGGSRAE